MKPDFHFWMIEAFLVPTQVAMFLAVWKIVNGLIVRWFMWLDELNYKGETRGN